MTTVRCEECGTALDPEQVGITYDTYAQAIDDPPVPYCFGCRAPLDPWGSPFPWLPAEIRERFS